MRKMYADVVFSCFVVFILIIIKGLVFWCNQCISDGKVNYWHDPYGKT